MNAPIPVVILAGGQGSRMGGNKAERRLAGKTLLEHAIAKASIYSPAVAISTGKDMWLPPDEYAVFQDKGDIEGPIAGLAAALEFARAAGAEHVLILPCDTPFLPDDLLQRLHGAIGDTRATLARCAGQLHPACSLWRIDSSSRLSEYLVQGRRSLVGFAESAGYIPVDWPDSSANLFFNVNTADDLLQAERFYSELL